MKRFLLFVLTIFVLLTGCASSNEHEVDVHNEEEPKETTLELQEREVDRADSDILPEWLDPYAQLGELPKPIYLSRETAEFSIDGNILFPESNILCVTKDIAGDNMTIINNDSDKIVAFVEEIEKTSVITEEEAVNPDAHLLGYHFSIVLLTSDGNYILMYLSAFDDGRINITIENGETNQTIWIKSLKLVDEMKQLADYEPFHKDIVSNLIGTVIVDNKGNKYQLSEETIIQVQNMLNKMYEVSGDYKCPFDVSIIFKTKEEEIEAKYCHDSCGVLVIQGVYYILEDQDAKWLSELIDGKFTK